MYTYIYIHTLGQPQVEHVIRHKHEALVLADAPNLHQVLGAHIDVVVVRRKLLLEAVAPARIREALQNTIDTKN